MVVEYCRYGSLRHYLTKKRDNFVDTMDDGIKWSALNAVAKAREAEEELVPPPNDDDYNQQRYLPPGATANTSYPSQSSSTTNYPRPRNYRGSSVNYPSMMSDSTSAHTMMTYLRSDGQTGASAFSGTSFASQFSCDEEIPLITKDLVSYSFQIARGMEYLASKKVLSPVHVFLLSVTMLQNYVRYVIVSYKIIGKII